MPEPWQLFDVNRQGSTWLVNCDVKSDGRTVVLTCTGTANPLVKVDIVLGVFADGVMSKVPSLRADDILVNAANPELRHTGGVAKSICDALGGPAFQSASDEIVRLTGRVPTGGYVFQPLMNGAKVCHVVAPKREEMDPTIIASTVHAVLLAAKGMRCQRVIIPMLGTGVYGVDVADAAYGILSGIAHSVEDACLSKKRLSMTVFVVARYDAAGRGDAEWAALSRAVPLIQRAKVTLRKQSGGGMSAKRKPGGLGGKKK